MDSSDHSLAQQQHKVIILLGAPGSGKGTQAALISKYYQLPHISTGDLFRENIKKRTALGKKAQTYVEAGQFPPDTLVFELFFERISRSDCSAGFILDGFPRTVAQAETLEEWLKGQKPLVLNLCIQDDAIVQRLSGRLTCPACSSTYHQDFSPPKASGICDRCQELLVQRRDDSPSVIRERLRVYYQLTQPVLHFYEKKGIVYPIPGDLSFEEVNQKLIATISSLSTPH